MMITKNQVELRRAFCSDSVKLSPSTISAIRNDASNALKSIGNVLETQHAGAIYKLKTCIDAYHDLHTLKDHAEKMSREAADLQTLVKTRSLPAGSNSDAVRVLAEFQELQAAAKDADITGLSVLADDDLAEWIDELAEAREKALETTLNRFHQALPAVRKNACAELCRIEDMGDAIQQIEAAGLELKDMLPADAVPDDLPGNIGKATFDPWSLLGTHCADRNASVLATKLRGYMAEDKAQARRSKKKRLSDAKNQLKDQVLDDITELLKKGA